MAKMKWMKKPKPELHIVSLSGGKDSTAMLLRMLEEGMRIDIILFCDTGLEFPAMYRHLEKLQRDIGRPITRVCSNHTFEHFLLQHEVRVKRTKVEVSEKKRRGYSWPGPRERWCTKELKEIPREAFLRPLREKYDIIEYVGLAADEGYRLERKNNQREIAGTHWWIGVWTKTPASNIVMNADIRGKVYMNIIPAYHVGVARCNHCLNCAFCMSIFQNYGRS